MTGDYDHCSVYDVDWSEVLATLQPPSPDSPVVPCQHGWEFQFDDIPYETVVSQVRKSFVLIEILVYNIVCITAVNFHQVFDWIHSVDNRLENFVIEMIEMIEMIDDRDRDAIAELEVL